MTMAELSQIIYDNNIPVNVTLESDSGWECGPTQMDGVWYNKKQNKIIFTQYISAYSKYDKDPDWKPLLPK